MIALWRQHDLVQLVAYLHVHVIDGRDVAEDELDVGDVKQRPLGWSLTCRFFHIFMMCPVCCRCASRAVGIG